MKKDLRIKSIRSDDGVNFKMKSLKFFVKNMAFLITSQPLEYHNKMVL